MGYCQSCGGLLGRDCFNPQECADITAQMHSNAVIEDGLALHPATRQLVNRFAAALAEKLAKAEAKYGYSDGWLDANWQADCREALLKHIDKGDPRDVAAYCAFMWHHGWSTSVPCPDAGRTIPAESNGLPACSVCGAPEQRSNGHRVQVVFDGEAHASPCHPSALENFGEHG